MILKADTADQLELGMKSLFSHLYDVAASNKEVPRGFEPLSLDSASRVLTVTPRDQVMKSRSISITVVLRDIMIRGNYQATRRGCGAATRTLMVLREIMISGTYQSIKRGYRPAGGKLIVLR